MIRNENYIKVTSLAWLILVFMAISIIATGHAHAALPCNACHTMPPLDSAAGERNPATGAFKGNHQGHSSNSTVSCIPCHGVEASSYAANHSAPAPGSGSKPLIRLTPALNNYSISHSLATYNRGTFFNQTSLPPDPLGTCSNVNCHFESATPAWGTTNFESPNDCSKCHGAAPADGSHPAASGSGKKHGDYYSTTTTSCVKCHPAHIASPSRLPMPPVPAIEGW